MRMIPSKEAQDEQLENFICQLNEQCSGHCRRSFRYLFTLRGELVNSILDIGARHNVVLVASPFK